MQPYLALGDSYTCAEGLPLHQSWTHGLVARLNARGWSLAAPRIIAQTGWTTGTLRQALADAKPEPTAQHKLISIMTGVNDQYDGVAVSDYAKHLSQLIVQAKRLLRPDGLLFAVSIPDWGGSPYAKDKGFDAETVAEAIDVFNTTLASIAQQHEVPLVDVTSISRTWATRDDAFLSDGLHPSAKQLGAWADEVAMWFAD